MNSIFAIIPARSGSKGIKDKNLLEIKEKSLLEWTISAAKKCPSISKIFVSTDSTQYAEIAIALGADVPFLRPKKFAKDNSPDIEFVLHALNEFKNKNEEPEMLVHLRPTTPLRDPHIIENAISMLKDSKHASSLRSIHEMPESAYKTMEINEEGMLMPLNFINKDSIDINAPRQSFPKTYQANGYVDILSTASIRKTNEIHGDKILAFQTDYVTEIDCMDDFKYIEYLVTNNTSFYDKVFS
jgi:CMP-N,N'-diacetyllegionaminic acid synthase